MCLKFKPNQLILESEQKVAGRLNTNFKCSSPKAQKLAYDDSN